MMHKAIFIDKDGTLIPDVPYNINPDLVTLCYGAGYALRRLCDAGYKLVIVSNQSGIARGLFDESALEGVWRRIDHLLAEFGVALDGFYYCPHLPDTDLPQYALDCACRKPKPGMLLAASRDLYIDLRKSWMIGDIWADSEAGNRAGCRSILIEKPDDPQRGFTEWSRPNFKVSSWNDAVDLILREVRAQRHRTRQTSAAR